MEALNSEVSFGCLFLIHTISCEKNHENDGWRVFSSLPSPVPFLAKSAPDCQSAPKSLGITRPRKGSKKRKKETYLDEEQQQQELLTTLAKKHIFQFSGNASREKQRLSRKSSPLKPRGQERRGKKCPNFESYLEVFARKKPAAMLEF